MDKYVTQEECENRREDFARQIEKETEDISRLYGETRALTENVKRLVDQNKWFMGIISSVLGGLLIWLITNA